MTSANQQDSAQTKSALITGAEQLLSTNWLVIALNHQQLDITNEDAVLRQVGGAQPDVVMNCVATADVDRCEREPEWAYAVNEQGVRNLARACRKFNSEFVHVSTDYVFDGEKQGFYTQEDEPNPLSVYA